MQLSGRMRHHVHVELVKTGRSVFNETKEDQKNAYDQFLGVHDMDPFPLFRPCTSILKRRAIVSFFIFSLRLGLPFPLR